MKEPKDHSRAKIKIMLEGSVFIQSILFSLELSFVDTIPTAGTNGTKLIINTKWYSNLTLEQKVSLLLHEAWHVAYQHTLGIYKHLDHAKLNMAQDYYINLQLTTTGFTLPPDGLVDSQYNGLSSLQIYKLLPDVPKSYISDVMEEDKNNNESDEDRKIKLDNILIKAVNMSKEAGEDPGKIPGEIRRHVEELLNPKLPWDVILMNYMNAYAKDDYSWKKPNKRFRDIYLPSLYSESIDNISILIDTSGSITQKDLSIFFTEIHAIRDMLQPKEIMLGSFDTRLYSAKPFQDYNSVELKGGGGTSSQPIQEFIENFKPDILLIFSDMYMDYGYLKDVNFPDLYWIATDGFYPDVPCGSIIEYDRS